MVRRKMFSAVFIFKRKKFLDILRRWNTISTKDLQINEAIKASSVRVVEGTEQLGIMPLARAKEIAYEKGLDLVLIAPNSDPPVCRIMDYGKYRYEQDKKEKESKRKQQIVEIKEIQLSFKIDTHDFETKARRAIGFLSDGNKVRVVLRFRGREMAHQQIGRDLLLRFEEYCREYGTADKNPVLEGRQLVMFINPNRTQRDKDAKGVKETKAKETVKEKAVEKETAKKAE